jgi:hypothetical protein
MYQSLNYSLKPAIVTSQFSGSSARNTFETLIEARNATLVDEVTSYHYRSMRGDFTFSIPTLAGDAEFYRHKRVKMNYSTSKRGLIWVTKAVKGAVYKVFFDTGIALQQIGADITIGGSSSSGDGSAEEIIDTIISRVAAWGSAGTHSAHKLNNTVIFRGGFADHLVVTCDYGDYIHHVPEADWGNSFAMPDPAILPTSVATGVEDCIGITESKGSDGVYGSTDFLVRVNPDPVSDKSNYYLRYNADLSAWVEDALHFIPELDATTMPVNIPKRSLDDIYVVATDVIKPPVGDDKSNAPPSFLNKEIKDFTMFNGRLAMATDDTIVFSTIGKDFDFFRSTTSQYLISDVVDLTLDTSRLGYRPIKDIFVLDSALIINTGLSQSKLILPTNMDISGAIFGKISSFDLGSNIPLSVRNELYFPVKNGNFTTIKSFRQVDGSGVYTDESVTKHCETYIRGNVVQSVINGNVVFLRTDDDKKTIYVQNSYVTQGTIVQNAWHKWTFAYDIKYMYKDVDHLKLVFEDTDNDITIYGKINIQPQDIVSDTDLQIGYKPYLDFYTEDTSLSSQLSNMIAVDKSIGKLVSSGDPNSVEGQYFKSKFTLSQIVPRQDTPDGKTKIAYGLLMIRRLAINLIFSGKLLIKVNRTDRAIYEHNYVPDTIGTLVVGRDAVTNETARFPVNGRSQDIIISVETDNVFTPVQADSVEWQGQLIVQGGR